MSSAAFVLVLCASYVAAMAWIDRGNGTFHRLATLGMALICAAPIVFFTYVARYWRWASLLRRQGHCVPYLRGLAAYLAGFALTATPGKAGELLRLRYFERMGVPMSRSLGTFVFERASDLLVILLFALLAAPLFPMLGALAAVVLVFVGGLFTLAAWPSGLRILAKLGQRLPPGWWRRVATFALSAAQELRLCVGLASFLRSMACGLVAWGLTSAVFMWLCAHLGIDLPLLLGWGIYPLAMLVGALSFVPGGVGTTELAIVLMLQQMGVEAGDGWAAAVAVRLVTLWLAIGTGALALLWLELVPRLGPWRAS